MLQQSCRAIATCANVFHCRVILASIR